MPSPSAPPHGPLDRLRELARLDALIGRAEEELVRLTQDPATPAGDPADPADPVRCQELWLAALMAAREELLRSA